MKFTSARLCNLKEALQGYLQTGVPLVGKVNGQLYAACGTSADDFGLFYWASLVSKFFNCSAQKAGYSILVGLIAVGALVAVTACLIQFKLLWKQLLAFCVLAGLIGIVWFVGDVHCLYFVTIAFIPWSVPLFEQQNFKVSSSYYFLCGLVAGLAHFIRSFAGLPLLVFLVTALITTYYFSKTKKIFLLACLVAGYGVGQLHTNYVFKRRNAYLAEDRVQSKPTQHIFWHSVYAGLGFIHNDFNIFFGDHVAERFEQRDPKLKYPSVAYERAVKQEVFKLIRERPMFIARTFAAKGGVLLLYFLMFAGFGFIPSLLNKRKWQWELPWLTALGASALPGLIAIPITMYLVGFISCSVFYGLFLLRD